MKSKSQELVEEAIGDLATVHFKNPVRLSFKWYEASKRRDIDNICFAKKFILDTLVHLGMIDTDGWRGVQGFTDSFYIDKDHPRIEVEIAETTTEETNE